MQIQGNKIKFPQALIGLPADQGFFFGEKVTGEKTSICKTVKPTIRHGNICAKHSQ
jgi:hypothetical protein